MKLVTITMKFLADDEESARERITNITDEYDDCRVSDPVIEDASLDDEDEVLGHDRAAKRRAMDALRRLAPALLTEIAEEARCAPIRARKNGYDDNPDELKDHLCDLYYERMIGALRDEYPEDDFELAWEMVVSWAVDEMYP